MALIRAAYWVAPGEFVRISHKEVSVAHADGIRSVLVAPLDKVSLLALSTIYKGPSR